MINKVSISTIPFVIPLKKAWNPDIVTLHFIKCSIYCTHSQRKDQPPSDIYLGRLTPFVRMMIHLGNEVVRIDIH